LHKKFAIIENTKKDATNHILKRMYA